VGCFFISFVYKALGAGMATVEKTETKCTHCARGGRGLTGEEVALLEDVGALAPRPCCCSWSARRARPSRGGAWLVQLCPPQSVRRTAMTRYKVIRPYK
jgi:hypothetical protein